MGDIVVSTSPAMPSLDEPFSAENADSLPHPVAARHTTRQSLPAFSFPQAPDPIERSDNEIEAFNNPTQPSTLSQSPRRPRRAAAQAKSVSTLPSFTFNPGVVFDPANQQLTPPESPNGPSEPTTPTRSRHKRTTTEIGGAFKPVPLISRDPSPSKSSTEASPQPSPGKPSESPQPVRGHRHRRSAAVSSRDLANLTLPLPPPQPSSAFASQYKSGGTPENEGRTLSHPPSAEGLQFGPSEHQVSAESAAATPTTTSNGSQSKQEQVTGGPSSQGHRGLREQALSANRPASSPALVPSSFFIESGSLADKPQQRSASFGDSKTPDFTFRGRYSTSSSLSSAFVDDEPQIDLDDAVVEPTTPNTATSDGKRGNPKSFAQRTMHSKPNSSGSNAPFLADFLPSHRRTESAPSLSQFSRPDFRRYANGEAATASEIGFEMNDVFEEDEEDLRRKSLDLSATVTKSKRNSSNGITSSTRSSNRQSRELAPLKPIDLSSEDDGSSAAAPRPPAVRLEEQLPEIDTSVERDDLSGDSKPAMRSYSYPMLQPPPTLKDSTSDPTLSDDASQSDAPHLDPSSRASCVGTSEASGLSRSGTAPDSPFSTWSFRNSVLGRNVLRSHSPSGSGPPPSSGSGATTPSRREARSSNRLSVVSLSKLVPGALSERRDSDNLRCQTSDGQLLGPQRASTGTSSTHQTRKKRGLQRLKFWKKPGRSMSGEGDAD